MPEITHDILRESTRDVFREIISTILPEIPVPGMSVQAISRDIFQVRTLGVIQEVTR